MDRFGNSLHSGAYADGKQGAKVVDFVGDLVVDVAVEVLSAGAATPVIAGKRAAKAGVTVAETGTKALAKAVKAVGNHADEALVVAKKAVAKADDVVKTARRGAGVPANAGVDTAQTAKKPVKKMMGLVERIGRAVDGMTGGVVGKVIHGRFIDTRYYNSLKKIANKFGFEACFVAGTPLMTLHGSKPIEELKSFEEFGEGCDWVWTRDEHNDDAEPRLRRVLRTFARTSTVLYLTVGNREVGTTHEHPFFVRGRGWVNANQLRVGDELRLLEPGWVRVEGIREDDSVVSVYNLEVEDDHTYFVGDITWGWNLWAHNANGCLKQTGKTAGGMSRLSKSWRFLRGPAAIRRHHVIPQQLLKIQEFVQRMQRLGFRSLDEMGRFLNKRIADIANADHIRLHSAGYNKAWIEWLRSNPTFSLKDLNRKMKTMMREFDIPFSAFGGKMYGR